MLALGRTTRKAGTCSAQSRLPVKSQPRASPTGHHPPEHYASLALVPLLAVFLALAVKRQPDARRE
jgi:hypothetical protein